jgi:hypothetical protein
VVATSGRISRLCAVSVQGHHGLIENNEAKCIAISKWSVLRHELSLLDVFEEGANAVSKGAEFAIGRGLQPLAQGLHELWSWFPVASLVVRWAEM